MIEFSKTLNKLYSLSKPLNLLPCLKEYSTAGTLHS